MVRGGLLCSTLILSLFLLFSFLEDWGRFGPEVRTGLFYCFFGVFLCSLFLLVILPGLRLLKIRDSLSREDAARIIGRHFPEIQDKLLNLLQLNAKANNELALASISQKTNTLKPISFTGAIDFRKIKRYSLYAALPLGLFFILLISGKGAVFYGSTDRILHY